MSNDDAAVRSLSSTLKKSWPSDKNMKASLENEVQMTSGLLRRASMVCRPGGEVDPKFKPILKDLILKNDNSVIEALSGAKSPSDINDILKVIHASDPNTTTSVLKHNQDSSHAGGTQQSTRRVQISPTNTGNLDRSSMGKTTGMDMQNNFAKLSEEEEKLKIARGLGSKRSRPESMATMTVFRDINRLRTLGETQATTDDNQDDDYQDVKTVDESSIEQLLRNSSINEKDKQKNFVAPTAKMNFNGSPTQAATLPMHDNISQLLMQQRLMYEQQLQQQNLMIQALQKQSMQQQMQANMNSINGMQSLGQPAGFSSAAAALLRAQQQQQQQPHPMAMGLTGPGARPPQQLGVQIQPQMMPRGAYPPGTSPEMFLNPQYHQFMKPGNMFVPPNMAALQSSLAASEAMKQQDWLQSLRRDKEIKKNEKLMVRREKKSNRERQRRLALNSLYDEVAVLLFEDEHIRETKDRAAILAEAVEFVKSTTGTTVPAHVPAEDEDEGDDGEEEMPGSEATDLTPEQKLARRRWKKSRREKQRRQTVNVLSERLGVMLNITEFKDKCAVLSALIKLMKGGKVTPSSPHSYSGGSGESEDDQPEDAEKASSS